MGLPARGGPTRGTVGTRVAGDAGQCHGETARGADEGDGEPRCGSRSGGAGPAEEGRVVRVERGRNGQTARGAGTAGGGDERTEKNCAMDARRRYEAKEIPRGPAQIPSFPTTVAPEAEPADRLHHEASTHPQQRLTRFACMPPRRVGLRFESQPRAPHWQALPLPTPGPCIPPEASKRAKVVARSNLGTALSSRRHVRSCRASTHHPVRPAVPSDRD